MTQTTLNFAAAIAKPATKKAAKKARKPVGITSYDDRKPAIVAALKAAYNCRKVTTLKHDRDAGLYRANVMNFNNERDCDCFGTAVLDVDTLLRNRKVEAAEWLPEAAKNVTYYQGLLAKFDATPAEEKARWGQDRPYLTKQLDRTVKLLGKVQAYSDKYGA